MDQKPGPKARAVFAEAERFGVAGVRVALGVDGCAPCGTNAPGWTCAGTSAIDYCDFDTHCLSKHVCNGGCTIQPPGTPDRCN